MALRYLLPGVVQLRGVAHQSDGDARSPMFLGLFEPGNRHQADNRSAGNCVASSHERYAGEKLDGLLKTLLGAPIIGLRQ